MYKEDAKNIIVLLVFILTTIFFSIQDMHFFFIAP